MRQEDQGPDFERLLEFLAAERGFDFGSYKRSTLTRRIRKRMSQVGVTSLEEYHRYLEANPQEFTHLFNTILINVTSFFRDPPMWEYLATEVLPAVTAAKADGNSIRIWSAGSSTGEEAYALAITVAEAVGEADFRSRVKIYASDVDEDALAEARQGIYAEPALADVHPDLLERYFERRGLKYAFREDLRRSIIFGRLDLLTDAPISRLDLVLCRNTLMYFTLEAQERILSRLHFALNDPGYLVLGKAEMLLGRSELFRPFELRHRIFVKVPRPGRGRPAPFAPGLPEKFEPAQGLRDLAFDLATGAQIVVDNQGSLVAANYAARVLFGLSPADLGRMLHELEVSYKPLELRSLIEQAYGEGRSVFVPGVERQAGDGGVQFLEVHVTPLFGEQGRRRGAGITFTDVTHFKRLQADLERSRGELETAYEELGATNEELEAANEELETTNEELQSTVEELETTNEELQSTNEELETTNEELQSTNEELHAKNGQLREQGEALDRVNVVLEWILTIIDVGVAVVDPDLTVRVWSERARELWGLRHDEVAGRSFLDLDFGLPMEAVRDPILDVVSGAADRRDLEVPAVNRTGKQIRCRVTCARLGPDGGSLGSVILMEKVEADPRGG